MFDSFAALIYVTDTEHNAVMHMYNWQSKCFEGDDQLYYEASFVRDGKTYLVAASRQREMGMTAAAVTSMKLISHYHPQYLIMPGIAAGVGEESTDNEFFGDVILANVVWNYSNGKYAAPTSADISFGTVGFISRPTTVSLAKEIVPYLEQAIASPENQTHVHFGPLASGSAVVANSEIVKKQVYPQYANTKGLEMEGYGVAYAAQEAMRPSPMRSSPRAFAILQTAERMITISPSPPIQAASLLSCCMNHTFRTETLKKSGRRNLDGACCQTIL